MNYNDECDMASTGANRYHGYHQAVVGGSMRRNAPPSPPRMRTVRPLIPTSNNKRSNGKILEDLGQSPASTVHTLAFDSSDDSPMLRKGSTFSSGSNTCRTEIAYLGEEREEVEQFERSTRVNEYEQPIQANELDRSIQANEVQRSITPNGFNRSNLPNKLEQSTKDNDFERSVRDKKTIRNMSNFLALRLLQNKKA